MLEGITAFAVILICSIGIYFNKTVIFFVKSVLYYQKGETSTCSHFSNITRR